MVFARIDHAAGAASVGMALRPTELLIFGNPKGGTPLMQDRQTAGIDLPVKALAWEDADGKTWLSYNDADWIAARHCAWCGKRRRREGACGGHEFVHRRGDGVEMTIIDLGPEGGDGAARSWRPARPKKIARDKRSYTGAFLKPVLARARASRAARDGAEDVEAAE